MKDFFIKSIILIFIVLTILLLIYIFGAPLIRDNNSYLSASIDKQYRLKTLPSPRIVFIGGSDVAFGLDSKKIENSTHCNVVNMGLQSGLGLSYMLNEAKDGIKKGDIIILAQSYHLSYIGDKKLATLLLESNPKAIHYFTDNIRDYIPLAIINLQRCLSTSYYKTNYYISDEINKKTKSNSSEVKIYTRDSFSKEGDLVSHLNQINRSLSNKIPNVIPNPYENIVGINKFIEDVTRVGAKVYFTYSCFPKEAFSLYKNNIDIMSQKFTQYLNCPILNTPETSVFHDSLFYEKLYHLNKTGRDMRTEQMVNLILPLIN